MQTINYWEQFAHTGKVEDYLSYVSGGEYKASQTTKEEKKPEVKKPSRQLHGRYQRK